MSSADVEVVVRSHLINRQEHIWHGVAIGWRSDIDGQVTPLDSTFDRITGIKLCLHNVNLLLISLYAPTSGRDEEFLECMSNLTFFLRQNYSSTHQVIIGADLNISSNSSTRRQEAWNNVCEEFMLSSHYPPLPTFHHHNGSSNSYLDCLITSSNSHILQLTQYCTLENALNLSSHDLILAETSIETEDCMTLPSYNHTYIPFERLKIKWNPTKFHEYQCLAESFISSALEQWESPESIPILIKLVSNLLVTAAVRTFESYAPSFHHQKQKVSKKLELAQKKLQNSHRTWKKAGKPSSSQNIVR